MIWQIKIEKKYDKKQKWFCHFGKLSDQRDTYKIKEKESKVRANVSEKKEKVKFW